MYVFPRTYMLSVFYMNLLVVYVLELKQTSAVQFASTRGTAITLFIFKYVLVGQHHFRYVCYSSKALPAAHSHTSSTLSSWTKKVRRLKADRLGVDMLLCGETLWLCEIGNELQSRFPPQSGTFVCVRSRLRADGLFSRALNRWRCGNTRTGHNAICHVITQSRYENSREHLPPPVCRSLIGQEK